MWPRSVKDEALVACGRRCCICHAFCGIKIELHHIVPVGEGGKSAIDNCIPLCFNCHADVGHYNPKHPKGTKYSHSELRKHRDNWFQAMAELAATEKLIEQSRESEFPEIFEEQEVELTGFVWRETFPGPPNYESLETDSHETYWILVLAIPITLIARSPGSGNSFRIERIKRLQMVLTGDEYETKRHLVLHDAKVTGRLFHAHTGHHKTRALIQVSEMEPPIG